MSPCFRVLHDARDLLKGRDVGKVCDYGAAEQGALIVDASKSYGPRYTGDPANIGLKQKINDILAKNKHADILQVSRIN